MIQNAPHWQTHLLFMIVLLLIGQSQFALAQAVPVDQGSKHHELVQNAASRLVEIQEADGAWPYEGVYRVSGKIPVGYRIGGTAIVCHALLESKLDDRTAADAAFLRGVKLILEELEHPLMVSSQEDRYDVRVWGHIYALDLFCRLHDAKLVVEHAEAIESWIDKLIVTLAEEELDGGGWNYASRGRHACFVTAPALQALLMARLIGKEVPNELFERGARVLLASRSENGAFHYSGTNETNRREAQVPGAIARNAICETTLWQRGHGDATRLKASIDDFHTYWNDRVFDRSKAFGTAMSMLALNRQQTASPPALKADD